MLIFFKRKKVLLMSVLKIKLSDVTSFPPDDLPGLQKNYIKPEIRTRKTPYTDTYAVDIKSTDHFIKYINHNFSRKFFSINELSDVIDKSNSENTT